MGFQQGLSGLSAASSQLDSIGNNVANASTIGFKSARSEFADMFSSSLFGTASTQVGIGSRVAAVTQQMTQGNITPTGRSLDLAINNNGFFVVKQGATGAAGSTGTQAFTRNGQFQVDRDGFIVNGADRLQGWMAVNGAISQGPVTDLQLTTSQISPQATTKIQWQVNLDSTKSPPATATFSPTDPTSYTWTNSTTVYDTLGNAHQLVMYYVKQAAPANTWNALSYVDGAATSNTAPAVNQYTLTFDTSGNLTNTTPMQLAFSPTTGAAAPMSFTLDYSKSTQIGQASGNNGITVDGFAPGTLKGINIDKSGIIQASFTNGQTRTVGQVALASFVNQQGLQNLGGNRWGQSFASGPVSYNAPGTGTAGTIQAQALEDSNVDLTAELVNMITAQRFYQANAQTVKTQDTLLQTLINLR